MFFYRFSAIFKKMIKKKFFEIVSHNKIRVAQNLDLDFKLTENQISRTKKKRQ